VDRDGTRSALTTLDNAATPRQLLLMTLQLLLLFVIYTPAPTMIDGDVGLTAGCVEEDTDDDEGGGPIEAVSWFRLNWRCYYGAWS